MKENVVLLGLLFLSGSPCVLEAAAQDVVINEISYHPPESLGLNEDSEFVELHNLGTQPQDVGGWLLKDGSDENFFVIPGGTSIAAGGYLVVAADAAALRRLYGPELPVVGNLDFNLANGGDSVRLLDAQGALVDEVDYDDDPPWPAEADGNGATLERVEAARLDADDFTNFAPSLLSDPPGTPGDVNSKRGARASKYEVLINEISYNPVRQGGVDPLRHCEAHEFVELHNRGDQPADLSRWRFEMGIRYAFPPGTVLPAAGFLVLYKDEAEFRARYPDPAITAIGPYDGILDDGGEDLLLVDEGGQPVDYVEYNDRFPWPVNPDGIQGTLELADPRSDNEKGNHWQESTDFKGTPGARNSAAAAFEASGFNQGPSITEVEARPAALPRGEERENIVASDDVLITARIFDPDGVATAVVEYQVLAPGDYIRRTDPRFATEWFEAPMSYQAHLARHEVVLPARAHRTLVRYRVRAADGSSSPLTSVAPRPGDPEPNFAYFVYDGIPDYTANVQSDFGPPGFTHRNLLKLPTYHMIGFGADIREAQYVVRDWGDNTYRWLVTLVFYWVDPATGRVESRVHDHVRMRLRGGVHRYHWPKRSWKLRFNKGNQFAGRFNDGAPYPRRRGHLNLAGEQHNDGRPRGESGVFESLAWKLFRETGVTAVTTTFVQLRVIDAAEELDQYAGDFFGIFLDLERIDTTLLQNLGLPTDEAASLYKIDGGPEKKHPDCTPSLDDVNEFTRGFSTINTAEWFRENFDLEKYFSFRSVVEFSHHYDMGSKNYYYYHNTATGFWEMVPWDLDNTFGSDSGDGAEPFLARVLPKFPVEFKSRMRFLWQTQFTQSRLDAVIDSWRGLIREVADADQDRWNHGPDCLATVPGNRGNQCDQYAPFEQRMLGLKSWIATRRRAVEAQFRDLGIPATPVHRLPFAGSSPALPVTLAASPYSDPDGDAHHRSHWLMIEEGGDWASPLWEETSETALESITPVPRGPAGEPLLVLGRSYEFRVGYEDATGRWSFLSEPTSFTVGIDDPTPPSAPADLRAVSVSARAVMLAWSPASDPETGVRGYRVIRDGAALQVQPLRGTTFTDRLPVARERHVYAVVATNPPGKESMPSAPVAVDIPAGNFGGWTAPLGGYAYFYDAEPGQDAPPSGALTADALDGTWARSLGTDNWDGLRPGEGPVPGGVEAMEVPGAAEDGGAASVLSIEDPGNPAGPEIPPASNNRRIFLTRRLGAADPFVDGAGLTLGARFRVNPAPRDLLAPAGQTPALLKGQIGIARFAPLTSGRRHFSLALNQNVLTFPGGELPVDMLAFQSLWLTIIKEGELAGTDVYRVKLYLNGAVEPAFDQAMPLPTNGVENVALGEDSIYLELGLSNLTEAGAIQVDYLGYQSGVHPPVPAGLPPGLVLRGDASGDGRRNLTDAIVILGYLFHEVPGFPCFDNADADDSGAVELLDALVLANYLFQNGSAPTPFCAQDPSADSLSCERSSCP